MIRVTNYKQPTTGVPIEWWEIRALSIGFVERVKLVDGRITDIPESHPADQRQFPVGSVITTHAVAILKYGGYFSRPEDDSIMPVSIVEHRLPDDASAQLEKELTAEGKESSIYYEADKLAVMHVEMFKGGEVLE